MKHKTKLVLLACTVLMFWLWRDVQEARKNGREAHRQYCQDHFCDGDYEPNHDWGKEVALKLNGQWFIGPKEYFSTGSNGAVFNWPNRRPGFRGGTHPEEFGVSPYERLIEIFLRSHDGVMHGLSRYEALRLAEAEGRVISKNVSRLGLEIWRIREKGELRPSVWYVATNFREENGELPVLGCDDENPKFDRCTTAFIWKPGIAADMRLSARHGIDWPDIYQETMRVLQLLKKPGRVGRRLYRLPTRNPAQSVGKQKDACPPYPALRTKKPMSHAIQRERCGLFLTAPYDIAKLPHLTAFANRTRLRNKSGAVRSSPHPTTLPNYRTLPRYATGPYPTATSPQGDERKFCALFPTQK